MATFDPTKIRKAVAEFTPSRPQRFQDLVPAKEVISELRQKRASYRAIAELLTQHCLPTSKTAIAAFCHEVLGEIVRPRRRRKRLLGLSAGNGEAEHTVNDPTTANMPAKSPLPKEPQAPSDQTRGPRIAKVRMIPPHDI